MEDYIIRILKTYNMQTLSKDNNLFFNSIKSELKDDLTDYVIEYCNNNQYNLKKLIEYKEKESIFFNDLPEEIFNLIISYTELNLLKNISKNCSYEGGFTLPFSDEWKKSIRNQNPTSASFLTYHSDRDFRFRENGGNIIGLRCKNELRCWNDEERKLLKKIINSFKNN